MLEGSILELGLDGFEDGVRLGELSRLQFGIYLVPIDANLKSASTRRDQLQRADSLFECQKFFRQTDGFWLVVSSRAVLDCYFRTHIYSVLLKQYVRAEVTSRAAGYQIHELNRQRKLLGRNYDAGFSQGVNASSACVITARSLTAVN